MVYGPKVVTKKTFVDNNVDGLGQGPLPWRYLAPESLRDLEFSVKSDVWAFGVTLWEVFTLSEVPYPGIPWSSDFLCQLQNGYRLTKPPYATNDV